MSVETPALTERLKISPEATRTFGPSERRKTPINVDLAEIEHKPLPTRSPHGHRVDTFTLKACIDSLQRELAKVEALAAGHRADFERKRDRVERLGAELLKATADMMKAKERATRLEGVLAAFRSWRRLAGQGGDRLVTKRARDATHKETRGIGASRIRRRTRRLTTHEMLACVASGHTQGRQAPTHQTDTP
jgi:hypothetical protein